MISHIPVSGLQRSSPHGLLSSHIVGVKTQPSPGAVATQVSVVQALLSLHGACGVKTQPSPGAVGTQVSVVQLLLSLHGACGVKTQASWAVAASELHVSVVQLLLSLQTGQKKIWPVPKLPAVRLLLHVVCGP